MCSYCFNESVRDYKHQNRTWRLGNEIIPETTEYTHLGINLNKYMKISSCITNANAKLRSSFFSIINNGIYENGIHPITSLKIYKSVVLPKALYGCELWHDINRTQVVKLERSHKFCIKYIQCIDRSTRSDIALSLLGCRSLESEMNFKKLTLLGKLCRLSTDFLAKDIFNNRLIRFIGDSHNKFVFFPDNYFRCSPLWLFCKKHPKMLIECQSTIKILSKLYSHQYTQICFRCGIQTNCLAEHIVYDCCVNEQYRQCLWTKLLNLIGFKIYMSLISKNTRIQITQLCTGLCAHLNEDNQDKCIQLVIFYFHKMLRYT